MRLTTQFGGYPYTKQKISTWKEEAAEFYASPAPDMKFSFMFWGACCKDTSFPRLWFIWEAETDQERKAGQDDINQRNYQGEVEAQQKRAKALIHGTPEWALLHIIGITISECRYYIFNIKYFNLSIYNEVVIIMLSD